MNETENDRLLDQLSRSRIFTDYQRAFGEATGLPLALRPVEAWQPVNHHQPYETPFKTDLEKLEDAWFHTRVLSPEKYEAMLWLPGIQTHFNRVFRKFVGESPTAYRRRLPGGSGR